jgi:ABC-type Zn2+ transport system substrate-binding protein/surface adhesin
VISSRDSALIEVNERKKKGGKQICVKLERTTIHISFKKEENVETNQMMRWKHDHDHDHDHDHQNQSHTLRRSVWRVPTTFFFFILFVKISKILLRLNNKKNHHEIILKPLKSGLKNLDARKIKLLQC